MSDPYRRRRTSDAKIGLGALYSGSLAAVVLCPNP
jgi:hypothetical protein